jgi:hypothetical protein
MSLTSLARVFFHMKRRTANISGEGIGLNIRFVRQPCLRVAVGRVESTTSPSPANDLCPGGGTRHCKLKAGHVDKIIVMA